MRDIRIDSLSEITAAPQGSTTLTALIMIVLIALLLLLISAAVRPKTYRVERALTISSSPDRLFAEINDLRRLNECNAFAKDDPTQKIDYSGVDAKQS